MKLLHRLARRQRPGLGRASYLMIDREIEQLLARLREYHPDFYERQQANNQLPVPDSTARFTNQPRVWVKGGWAKGTKPTDAQKPFRKTAANLLEALIEGKPNGRIKNGQIGVTTQLDVELAKVIMLEAKEANVPISVVVKRILAAHYKLPTNTPTSNPAQT